MAEYCPHRRILSMSTGLPHRRGFRPVRTGVGVHQPSRRRGQVDSDGLGATDRLVSRPEFSTIRSRSATDCSDTKGSGHKIGVRSCFERGTISCTLAMAQSRVARCFRNVFQKPGARDTWPRRDNSAACSPILRRSRISLVSTGFDSSSCAEHHATVSDNLARKFGARD